MDNLNSTSIDMNLVKSTYYTIKNSNKTLNFKLLENIDFTSEAKIMSTQLVNFGSNISSVDKFRYTLSVINLVFLLIFAILGVLAYFFKRNNILLAISYIIFLNIIATYSIVGLTSSFFMVSIDFCQNVKLQVDKLSIPIKGEGLGFYVSCPSKVKYIYNLDKSNGY